MSEVPNFKHIQQPFGSSACWIACAAMFVNCATQNTNATVQSLVRNFELNVHQMGNPISLIKRIYNNMYGNDMFPMDSYAIPTVEELEMEFAGNNIAGAPRPVLCCVGADRPKNQKDGRYLANDAYKDGHWILLVGSDGNKLKVADPELPKLIEADYQPQMYLRQETNLFWENTTYFNF